VQEKHYNFPAYHASLSTSTLCSEMGARCEAINPVHRLVKNSLTTKHIALS
jgi:hypothetical protein